MAYWLDFTTPTTQLLQYYVVASSAGGRVNPLNNYFAHKVAQEDELHSLKKACWADKQN